MEPEDDEELVQEFDVPVESVRSQHSGTSAPQPGPLCVCTHTDVYTERERAHRRRRAREGMRESNSAL